MSEGGIGITEQDGKRTVYRVKPLEEITIADWRGLTHPPIEATDPFDIAVELVARHCTLPKSKLRRIAASDMYRLMEVISTEAEKIAAHKAKVALILGIRHFTHGGIKYNVPQDLENEVTFGQFEDLEKVLLPQCETDADMHRAICASLCLPEGEEYDGGKVMERMAAFETLPVMTAMEVYAFFFGNSERFEHLTSRCLSQMLTTRQHKAAQVLTDLLNGTGAS